MKENSQIQPVFVQKADMAVSQLTSGGVVLREQLKKFILVNIKKAKMLPRLRVITMSRNEREIPKMTTFGSRVWHPGIEMEELPIAGRVRPGFTKVTITTQEIIAQINFPKYFLKAQVEGPAFQNTLIAYLGLHSARDFDDMAINGDTTSADDFLALNDGMRALMTTNNYAGAGASVSGDMLDAIMRTMPEEYADQDGLGFFTSRGARASYRRELGARIGPLGDANTISTKTLEYDDVLVDNIPMIPTDLGMGNNQTVVLHLNPKQFIFAIEEDVELETEYSKRARMWSVIMTARVGQNFEHEPATVQATAISNS